MTIFKPADLHDFQIAAGTPPCIFGFRLQSLYSCGLRRFTESARYRVRTCDPYRVKVHAENSRMNVSAARWNQRRRFDACFSNSPPAQALVRRSIRALMRSFTRRRVRKILQELELVAGIGPVMGHHAEEIFEAALGQGGRGGVRADERDLIKFPRFGGQGRRRYRRKNCKHAFNPWLFSLFTSCLPGLGLFFPQDASLPPNSTGSASALPFSKLSRCSLMLWPARSLTPLRGAFS